MSGAIPAHGRRRQTRTLIVSLSSWRRPMKPAVLTLALALTLAVVPGASASHAPTSAAASAAFGRLLHQRYGDVHGFWTCPIAGDVIGARTSCLAEVRAAYDWGFLAQCAGSGSGHPYRCDAYDGNGTGLFRFFLFTCSGSRDLVTCTNRLGDSMRYRPHPG